MRQHGLEDATLIGHSMGAKTVMTMALRDPSCCANIIAVDNAPVDAALTSDFPRYVEGMRKVEERRVNSQKEADQILEPYAKACMDESSSHSILHSQPNHDSRPVKES